MAHSSPAPCALRPALPRRAPHLRHGRGGGRARDRRGALQCEPIFSAPSPGNAATSSSSDSDGPPTPDGPAAAESLQNESRGVTPAGVPLAVRPPPQ